MLKIIFIYLLFPLTIYAGNIGLCGGKFFLKRQKLIDFLVLELKHSDEDQKKICSEKIINEYGYIGIENLIRYNENFLKEIFLKLLNHKDFYVQYKSLYALRKYKELNNDILLTFLNSTNIYLKDMAFSSLAESSNISITNKLNHFLKYETNQYIQSSLKYAKKRITKDLHRIFPDFNYVIKKGKLNKFIYYKSGDKIKHYQEKYSKLFLKNKELLYADSFIPPIIKYEKEFIFKGRRISFGVGDKIKHTGDDCGWFREGASVYAIGTGIIRLIHHSPDWGFLIVIEHKLKDNSYICSIYGHLSMEIYVKAGDIVNKGDKIGTIGLSYSIENGGYGAHLHFGISKGRWLKSKYTYGHNISVIYNNKEQEVEKFRLTENGIEIIFKGGMQVNLEEMNKDKKLQDYLFWLKGYEFSKDIDRIWLDPQEFLKKYK